MDEMKKRVFEKLTREIANNREKVKKFAEKLVEDPAYQFSWADTAMDAAARIAVFEKAALILQDTEPMEKLHEIATREVVRGARHTPSSTSVPSNLMALKVTAAWAEVAEMTEKL